MATKFQPGEIEKTIARMRAAGDEERAEADRHGREYGEAWAKEHATPVELRRLATARAGNTAFAEADDRSAYTAAESVYFAMHPEHDRDRAEANEFWEFVLGDDHASEIDRRGLVNGFVDGALAVWAEVEDKL